MPDSEKQSEELSRFEVDGIVPVISKDEIIPHFAKKARGKYKKHKELSQEQLIELRRQQNRDAARRMRRKKAQQRAFLDEQILKVQNESMAQSDECKLKELKQKLTKLKQSRDDVIAIQNRSSQNKKKKRKKFDEEHKQNGAEPDSIKRQKIAKDSSQINGGFRSNPPSPLQIHTVKPLLSAPLLLAPPSNKNYLSPLPDVMRYTPICSIGTGGILISPFCNQFNDVSSAERSPNGHFIFSPINHCPRNETNVKTIAKKQVNVSEKQPIKKLETTKHRSGIYNCDLCQKPLICPTHLSEYRKTKNAAGSDDRFRCFECDDVLESKTLLQRHIKDSHTNLLTSLESIFNVQF